MTSKALGRVAIFTLADDLHALTIQRALRSGQFECFVVETSRLARSGGVRWEDSGPGRGAEFRSREGIWFRLNDVDVLWWRRVNAPQLLPSSITSEAHVDVVNGDWKASVLGAVLTDFGGIFISDPEATRRAENKLVQLRTARCAGLTVPRTLVTQDIDRVRSFFRACDGNVIMKSIRGTTLAQLAAVRLGSPDDLDEQALQICPVMFQEQVLGSTHLRVNCFGDEIHAVRITSETLDWRRKLDSRFEAVELPEALSSRVAKTLRLLRLRMGVVDLKLNEQGIAYWLEVNPQGQFLFLEPLAGINLTDPFTEFLRRMTGKARTNRRRPHTPNI